ncbi:Methylglutaconyl-CoA hydratase [Rubellimicrobium mesophilum DSM 19309]|uniref:Methylglutaconyl-CoA hydratase n=1 Tax=Rubellimicrobium mesophilum DSM 19309 TaxID=442562 RepID=A0A017HK43_9RHOB|nr:crotonase/enoyl-CoA hydratase family protein [Rubellimicrobium mesophilum]EYD74872.1 Methylglutaconyl-CoA hydratase [Rubellimicrobium mesophilum DSM 19309]
MFRTIMLDTDGRGVARLTLDRPERHNALDATMISELTEAAERLGQDPAVRVVVLAAAGPTFCAGGDLGWMREQMVADGAARAAEARRIAGMLRALDTLPKPLVAEVQGPAYGGGVGLLSVCDVAVGAEAEAATFALTETRLGLIPATIGPYILARIGVAASRRLMLSSRRFDTREALSLGLLTRVVPPERLRDGVEEEVRAFLACAPGAVAAAKRLIRTLGGGVDAATVEASIAALVERWESEEAREGVAAFFERRDPAWRLGDPPPS